MKRPIFSIGLTLFLLGPALAADPAKIDGYCDSLSVVPGEIIRFHVSTDQPTFTIEVLRVGATRESVWKQEGIAGQLHAVPRDASARGCRWPASAILNVPLTWRSGYYQVRLKAAGTTSNAFFVVRAKEPGKNSKILLQLATNTYNAYNNWGGYSLYAYNGKDHVQGRRVSFDRPTAGLADNWEIPFIEWAERSGYSLDYAVNSDLEFHPDILANYALVLSVGHDEYWSGPMRDHLEAYIAKGGNVAFFSGNSVCWQVRSEESGRALACWKQDFGDDPVYRTDDRRTLTTLWSHHLVGRPENRLTGVGFLFGGYHKSHNQFMDGPGAFSVQRPDHWVFEGTEMKRGEAFGGKDTIVGYECDGCEFAIKDGLPIPTHKDGTPQTFVMLATAPAKWHPDDCEWYERWEKGRVGAAVLGVYTQGGTVFTCGSTDWSHGLKGRDPKVERITRNVLDRLGKAAKR